MSGPIESTVITSDKYKIHVKKWAPASADKLKAQLVFVHGYLEHCGRYYEFGKALAEQGIALTVFDCRGHGKSDGQRAYCWKFDQYHLDLEAVLGALNIGSDDESKTVPLFLGGHSAGGVIVLDYFITKNKTAMEKFKGTIIMNPFLTPADRIPAWKIWASRILAWIVPVLPISGSEELTSEVLMHGEDKRREHDEDPLVLHNATVGWGYGVIKTQDKLLNVWDKKLDLPVLFSFADQDKVADPVVNKKFGQDIVSPDKTIDERKDKFHETLNEPDRKELYALIGKWVLDHAK